MTWGVQGTEAAVRVRLEMLRVVRANAGAASAACPRIVRDVVPDVARSVWNCTQAAVTVAPFGTPTPTERISTV